MGSIADCKCLIHVQASSDPGTLERLVGLVL